MPNKGKNVRSRQTHMGDFYSKSNKSKKSVTTEGHEKESETEAGTKVEQTTKKLKSGQTKVADKKDSQLSGNKTGKSVEKKEVLPVTNKAGKSVEKKEILPVTKKAGKAVEKKQGQAVETRTSLKRKVTGAGMFSFSWTRGAQRDTEEYRNGYPGKEDDLGLDDNYRFYTNKIPSKPDGDYIDQIHIDWWGDYRLLEVHHGYIQWLFPIRESGLNWHAQVLQLHEIKKIQRNKTAMKRVLTSYKMMLDFYGMKLDNEDDGTIVREENWRDRFRHLNRSYHNYLRITRILKSLGEFGYEHLKKNFVKFILYEGLVEGTLSNLIDSCVKYWIGVLKEDEEREEIFDYYENLAYDENLKSKRRNRSPSPPSYSSNWSNKDSDSKTGKKVISKTGKEGKPGATDKKDEIDGDETVPHIENKFSDDEDETLYYAMSLIDEDIPNQRDGQVGGQSKPRKEHEISDSGEENEDHQEESQEMAHWNREAKEANEEDLEGGSESYESLTENDIKETDNTEKSVGSSEENPENNEKNVKNETVLKDHSINLNEESKTDTYQNCDETNKMQVIEKEDKGNHITDDGVNDKLDSENLIEDVSQNSDQVTANENIDSSRENQEMMDTNETKQGQNMENETEVENDVKTEDVPCGKSEKNDEENMEI